MLPPNTMGSPQNTFNTMQKPQANPQQLATALQNYNTPYVKDYSMGADRNNPYVRDYSMGAKPGSYQRDYSMGANTNQYAQQANQNYAMPGGQGQAPFGFNAYTQGLNKSTNMQPMLPNPQLAQAQQY